MERIHDDDPRLCGWPAGGVYRERDSGWRVIISKGTRGKDLRVLFNMTVHKKDHGNDMDATRRAAEIIQQEASDNLGLTYNKCAILDNGDVSMDVGGGYKTRFSPGKLDRIITRRWWFYIPKKSNHLVYVYGRDDNGKNLGCHRYLTDATREQEVDHRSGDPLDNTDGNLRVTTAKINAQNRMLSKRNKTGVNAVTVECDTNGSPIRYRAIWTIDDQDHSKSFAVSKFANSEDALAAATIYRDKIEKKISFQSRRATLGQGVADEDMEGFVVDKKNRLTKEQLKEQREKVAALFTQGVSYREAAKQSGAKEGTVEAWYVRLRRGQPLVGYSRKASVFKPRTITAKPFNCPQCNFKAAHKSNIYKHVRRTHTT